MLTKDMMIEFMKERALCVISTVGPDAKPESAIVGFTHTADLELVIGTSNKSRKYANMTQNRHVAVVIGDEKGEVQYEGDIEVLPKDDYTTMVEQGQIVKLPGAAQYRDDPNQMFLKITPTWIRFLKHGEGGGMQEFTEFTSGGNA